MIPLLIVGAAVAAGAAIYNAYQQGKISREEYERKRKLLEQYQAEVDRIGPGSPPPPLSMEQYQIMGQYAPEVASFYEQQAPELITEAGSTQERGYQRDVMSRLSNLAQTGDDAISRAAREQAGFEADAAAKRRREQILREYSQRGMGGSGQQLLADIAGSQQADVAQRQAALQAQAGAQQRAYQALGDLGSLASNVRQQNTSTERANRDIMNQFTRDVATNRNAYNRYVAQTRNDAQQTNLNNLQNVANANVGIRNQENFLNAKQAQDFENQRRNFELTKADLAFNEGKGLAGLYANNGRQDAQNWSQVGSTVGSGAMSIGAGLAGSQPRPAAAPQQPVTEQINYTDEDGIQRTGSVQQHNIPITNRRK